MEADLWRRYSAPARHYHNLAHIGKMLDGLEAAGARTPERELAIWFHDGVYDPMGKENELESARFFERTAGRFLPPESAAEVVRLILATDFRRPRSGKPDEALLIDLDFSILGAPWPDYDAYRHAVRREYAMVPDEAYKAGRGAVLRQFLSAPLFATGHFAALEQPARRNIQRELELLAASS